MSPSHSLHCDACDAAAVGDGEHGAVPEGWRFLRMEGYPVLLCACCAPPEGQALAITPELCGRLAARGIRLGICASLWGIGVRTRRADDQRARVSLDATKNT